MTLLLRHEARVVLAALRRVAIHPTRRALWIVVVSIAAVAIGFDIATSDAASRNLGAWAPSPLLLVGAALLVLALAALAGRMTPLTYGTRPADVTWWRYAGIGTQAGRHATTAVLTLRATATIALGAVPLGALFALAAPQRAGSVLLLALVAIVLTPVAVLVSSATAPRETADDVSAAHADVTAHAHRAPAIARRAAVPRGLAAARWLVARRRSERLVPYERFVAGAVGGIVAPRAAGIAGGELVAMAIVIGGAALLLDGALRRTTAPATLLSPWWRSAIGTSPRAIVAWALADATAVVLFGAGAAIGLGVAFGAPLLALAALPIVVLVPLALRLIVLGVDSLFPSALDRRGAGASLRVAAVAAATAAIVALSLFTGVRGGAIAAVVTASALLAASVAASARWCAARLCSATG
jgi:hypothetical protein